MQGQRFTEIIVRKAVLPFRINFSHNLATRDETETLFVSLRFGKDFVGFGQALPRTYLTGETVDGVVDTLRNFLWPRFVQLKIPEKCDFLQAMERFAPIFVQADGERKNAAYASVEVAAMDAVLKSAGLPAGHPGLFGQAPLPLVGVVSGSGARKAMWLARILRWLGYRRFKVKVGADREADERRLAAVRGVIGPDAWLAVDANCAWTYDEAIARMRELRRFGVALVEEPLRQECRAGVDFRALENAAGLPVMADESLCTLADTEALLRDGSPSWWNLRLVKNGGFSGMAALAHRARENGIHIYGGILVGETGLLAAAGRIGMAMAGAECGEYGFPRFFLRRDPFRGSPAGYFGALPAPTGRECGFGVRVAGQAGSGIPGEVVFHDKT